MAASSCKTGPESERRASARAERSDARETLPAALGLLAAVIAGWTVLGYFALGPFSEYTRILCLLAWAITAPPCAVAAYLCLTVVRDSCASIGEDEVLPPAEDKLRPAGDKNKPPAPSELTFSRV